jgi:AraC-like DNA-binding protein
LTENLRDAVAQVPDEARSLITPPFDPVLVHGRALTGDDLVWARTLMAQHLCAAARRLLDTARLTDFLVRELFVAAGENSAVLVSRAERASLERVERVKAQVLLQLDEVQSLESLARTAGCSPHYLSRTFAQITGMPLMLWIRRARIERAAELIASGRCNVSEAALEVGYHSFSHFSRAFSEEKGVSPSKWIAHLATQRQ